MLDWEQPEGKIQNRARHKEVLSKYMLTDLLTAQEFPLQSLPHSNFLGLKAALCFPSWQPTTG